MASQKLDELSVVKVRQRVPAAEPARQRALVEAEHLLVRRLLVARQHHRHLAAACVHLRNEPIQDLPRRLLHSWLEL
eukprot:2378506-Prymnesium_polylepis.1